MSLEILKLERINENSYIEIQQITEHKLFCIEVFHPDYGEEAMPTLIDCGQAKKLMEFLQEKLKDV